MSKALYIGCDNRIKVSGLKKTSDNTFINNATVTCTLVDASGAPVSGIAWPVTLAYVPASSGDYEGIIGMAASLIEDQYYTAKISATGGAGLSHDWEITTPAVVDRS